MCLEVSARGVGEGGKRRRQLRQPSIGLHLVDVRLETVDNSAEEEDQHRGEIRVHGGDGGCEELLAE